MSYNSVRTFEAGPSKTGLSTVAWSLDGGQTWSTVGVSELPGVPGTYQRVFTFADNFAGVLSWTTGGSTPRKASEEINPIRLGPDGLDAISVADPGGISNMNTLPKMIVATWRWIYKKTTLTATQMKTYADDNITVNVTQAVSDDGSTQQKGAGG